MSLEVSSQLASPSSLLLHLERVLGGVKVLAKKSWVMTDDFEAYFTYKTRLFVMSTPFVNVWVSLIGMPADVALFEEIERAVQSYNWRHSLWGPLAFARYFLLPLNPPRALVEQHESGRGA